jgi:hypothetical protein
VLRPLFLGANDCRLLSLCHHDCTITLHRELGRGSVWGVGQGKDTTGMVICCQGAGSHHVSLLYLISDDVKGRVFSTRGDSPFSGFGKQQLLSSLIGGFGAATRQHFHLYVLAQ